MKMRCARCDRLAVWQYGPGEYDEVLCEVHVPRGCSCQSEVDCDGEPILDESGMIEYTKDEQGRELPCCEWDYCPYGVDDEESVEDDFVQWARGEFGEDWLRENGY